VKKVAINKSSAITPALGAPQGLKFAIFTFLSAHASVDEAVEISSNLVDKVR
jgi:hypothetical protein